MMKVGFLKECMHLKYGPVIIDTDFADHLDMYMLDASNPYPRISSMVFFGLVHMFDYKLRRLQD